jgi:hypothetical protein
MRVGYAFHKVFEERSIALADDRPMKVFSCIASRSFAESLSFLLISEEGVDFLHEVRGISRLGKDTVLTIHDSFLKSFQTGDDDRETGDARFEDRNTEPFHGPWDGDIGCDGDIGRVEEELDVFSGKIREEDDSILESKLSDGLFAAREETHVTRDTFFGDSTGSDEEH